MMPDASGLPPGFIRELDAFGRQHQGVFVAVGGIVSVLLLVSVLRRTV